MDTLHTSRFFKYIDIEGGKKSLKKRTFKFSVPSVTNDPFECYGGLIENDQREDLIKQLIDEDILKNSRVGKLKKIVDEDTLNSSITKHINDITADHVSLLRH